MDDLKIRIGVVGSGQSDQGEEKVGACQLLDSWRLMIAEKNWKLNPGDRMGLVSTA